MLIPQVVCLSSVGFLKGALTRKWRPKMVMTKDVVLRTSEYSVTSNVCPKLLCDTMVFDMKTVFG